MTIHTESRIDVSVSTTWTDATGTTHAVVVIDYGQTFNERAGAVNGYVSTPDAFAEMSREEQICAAALPHMRYTGTEPGDVYASDGRVVVCHCTFVAR